MLADKYRSLSQQQLLEKAHDLGVCFEKYSGSCSQCTAAALKEILGFEDVVVRVATSSCGGVIGGTIVLDYYLGRPADMVSATQAISQGMADFSRAMEAARSLCERFIRQYGSILCPQIQAKIYGRSFNLQDPTDWKAFEEAGAHTDPTKCMSVVGNAARWTLETLLEMRVVSL